MPTMSLPGGLELFYQIDDYTDPWGAAESVVLLHGNSESSEAWRTWVPYLGRRYRVVRPDQRGFGRSTPMARDFPWSLDVLIDDLVRFTAELNLTRFHLVAAKITYRQGTVDRRQPFTINTRLPGHSQSKLQSPRRTCRRNAPKQRVRIHSLPIR